MQYSIERNNNEIGKLLVTLGEDSLNCRIKAVSNLSVRILFRFSIHITEEVLMQNNIMVFSSIYRKWNGREKVNRQTKKENNSYAIHSGGHATSTRYYPVVFHVLQLFIREPVNVQQVYSENLQKFLSLKRTGPCTYRLLLPDGNYTEYSYVNGKCTRVNIENSLYTVRMILQQ